VALENRPQVKEAEHGVWRQKETLTAAKLENIPDLTVGVEYIRVEDGMTRATDDGEDAWMIPLSINVPIWQNRIGAQIKEKRKDYEVSQNALKSSRDETEFLVRDAYYRVESANKLVNLYASALIPRAQLALESDRAGYESGHADFLNLLDSERVYLEAQLAFHRALTDSLKGYADLNWALGRSMGEEVTQ